MRYLLPGILLLVPFTSTATPEGEGERTDSRAWIEEAKLLASDGGNDNLFGFAVDLEGDTAIVGARGLYYGSVYVFVRTGFLWTLQQKLVPAAGDHGYHFGSSVDIAGDTAVIGWSNDDDAGESAGSTCVYVRSGTTWNQQAKLLASDANEYDFFGFDVALDGDTLVIGTASQDLGLWAGSAFVFVRSGSTWIEQAKFVADDPADHDFFGCSVAICEDVALVGSRGRNDSYPNAGAVYVFVRSGTSWSLETKLLAGDGSEGDLFGTSVSLDGDRALVGAPCHEGTAFRTGAAYIFERLGTTWRQRGKLVAGNLRKADRFGSSVAIEGDRAIIGVDPEGVFSELGLGSAYVFDWTGTTWTEQAMLVTEDVERLDDFGTAISISGNSILVGAQGNDDLGHNSGSAYVFSLVRPPGVGYCFGDPSSGTPCPCGNDNDGSVPGSGCDNGAFPSGAQLTGSGIASAGNDSLVLSATHQEPYNTGLYFQARNDLSPGVIWGNGLRCAGGGEVRLQVRMADGEGNSHTTITLGARGGVAPGDTCYYQLWYRTSFFPPCGSGVGEFNTTNGYVLTWHR